MQFQQRLVGLQEHMMSFAIKLTANRDDALDLLQDTTLKVLDNQEKFVDNINFAGWVMTIMRNIFIGEFYQFNLSSCIRQQNSLTAQFVSFSLSNLANIFYPPPQFLQ